MMCETNHSPDWSRDFISDQAHTFLHGANQRDASNTQTGPVLLARCAEHLMARCQCSRRTAETYAGQAVAEIASRSTQARFDMARSTPYALFLDDYALGTTRLITVDTLQKLLRARWPSAGQSGGLPPA